MTKKTNRDTVVVAMSGGVDSSVAAALLHEQGYDVIGVTMNLWDYERTGGNINKDSGCCSIDTMDDARAVCHKLGIPHYVVNLREQFESAVTDNFITEYLEGRTPNPCVRCNTFIKWGVLLQKAEELGAEKISTGHYARSEYNAISGRYLLRQGKDGNKDQSYALWGIRQPGLQKTLFPIGGYTKPEIREIARNLGLRTAEKKESQEICFIPDNDYARYLRTQRPDEIASLEQGTVVDQSGEVLGQHHGFPFYTIGQRKGIGVALGEPAYVTEIDAGNNLIKIGNNDDLMHEGLVADNLNWISIGDLPGELKVTAKIRYKDAGENAVLSSAGKGRVKVVFEVAQRAVTPGQSVVFYHGDVVVGGGVIASYLKKA